MTPNLTLEAETIWASASSEPREVRMLPNLKPGMDGVELPLATILHPEGTRVNTDF